MKKYKQTVRKFRDSRLGRLQLKSNTKKIWSVRGQKYRSNVSSKVLSQFVVTDLKAQAASMLFHQLVHTHNVSTRMHVPTRA